MSGPGNLPPGVTDNDPHFGPDPDEYGEDDYTAEVEEEAEAEAAFQRSESEYGHNARR